MNINNKFVLYNIIIKMYIINKIDLYNIIIKNE